MRAQGEDKRKSIGLTVSILVHGILLLLFFFIVAWREPNPPIPEYGIELSFGMAVSGKSTSPKKISAPQPRQQPTESTEQEESVPENANSQETSEQAAPSSESTDQPVEVEESSETSNSEPTTQESDPVQEDVSEPPTIKEEIKNEETSEETGIANDDQEEEDSPEKNNEEEESKGNNGTKTIDERALYGRKEGVSKQGSYLNIKGWTWDGKPKPDDTSRENGKIVFQITIDDRGDIIGIKTLESTVTPAVEKVYKDEVGRLTFSPTSDNFSPAAISKGEITFVIRSR